jgi:hypothetical protein
LEYGRALAHETADGVCDFWMTDLECTVDDEMQGALDSVGEEESLFWNLMIRVDDEAFKLPVLSTTLVEIRLQLTKKIKK